MALPDALVRREILYGEPKRPSDFVALGEEYLQEGRRTDALECFEKIEDPELRKSLLVQVRDPAIKGGDAFILMRINEWLPLTEAEWSRAQKNAEAAGRPRYALRIARHREDEEDVVRLELELGLRQPEEPSEDEAPASEAGSEAADDEDGAAKAD